MSRDKHKNKEIEEALRYAESHGWIVENRNGHCWGIIKCPMKSNSCRDGIFCHSSVWCTPKNPTNHARQIKRIVDNCINNPKKKKE